MGSNTIEDVIILGAGASATDGAPLQRDLFREYFVYIRDKKVKNNLSDDLRRFFNNFFKIDTKVKRLDKIAFPTFEEVLGLIELSLTSGEKALRVTA